MIVSSKCTHITYERNEIAGINCQIISIAAVAYGGKHLYEPYEEHLHLYRGSQLMVSRIPDIKNPLNRPGFVNKDHVYD